MAPKKPATSGKDWGPKEVAQLKKELRSNTPTRLIGHHLKRSPGAVQQKEQPRTFHEADEQEPLRDRRQASRPLGQPRRRSSRRRRPRFRRPRSYRPHAALTLGGGEPLLDAQIQSGGSRPAAWWNSMATRRAMARDLGMPDTL